jgi:hypothetical protein
MILQINRSRVGIPSSVSRRWSPILHAVRGFRRLAIAGGIAWVAASCASTTPERISAVSTDSAQTLVMLITQMRSPSESGFTPSPTSRATPSITPTRTAVSTGTSTLIPTVPLTTPTWHPFRATYAGSTPTTNGTSLLTSTITSRCNAAYFVGNVAPILENSKVNPGATFVQTWVIRNVGTCTWYPSYMLYWHSGARFEGPKYIDFPEIVPPNTNTFLSLTLIAPDDPGNYYARWYMRDQDFNQFGIGPDYSDPLMIRIIVVA